MKYFKYSENNQILFLLSICIVIKKINETFTTHFLKGTI